MEVSAEAKAAVAVVEAQAQDLLTRKSSGRTPEAQERNAQMEKLRRAMNKPLPPLVVARLEREKSMGRDARSLLSEFIEGEGWGLIVTKEKYFQENSKLSGHRRVLREIHPHTHLSPPLYMGSLPT